MPDARQPDLKNRGSSTRSRIRHTSQGDAAAANVAAGILMVDQGLIIPPIPDIYFRFYMFSVITHIHGPGDPVLLQKS